MGVKNASGRGAAPERRFVVVHPLDDEAEPKVEVHRLGRMKMTRTVKVALLVLRLYLLLMTALLVVHVFFQR